MKRTKFEKDVEGVEKRKEAREKGEKGKAIPFDKLRRGRARMSGGDPRFPFSPPMMGGGQLPRFLHTMVSIIQATMMGGPMALGQVIGSMSPLELRKDLQEFCNQHEFWEDMDRFFESTKRMAQGNNTDNNNRGKGA